MKRMASLALIVTVLVASISLLLLERSARQYDTMLPMADRMEY